MSIFDDGADDFRQAAAALTAVSAGAVPALRATMAVAGEAFAKQWADNARETSGEHGKHYPNSITSNLALTFATVSVDVGPDRSKPQGGMGKGFEFGSKNQPPHLDGVRAMDASAVVTGAAVMATIDKVFDGA